MPSFINNTEFDFIPIDLLYGILLIQNKLGINAFMTDVKAVTMLTLTNKQAIELLKKSEADSITQRNISVWIHELEKQGVK